MSVLVEQCTALRRLNVMGCRHVGDRSLRKLHGLEYLNAGCTRLTDEGLRAVAAGCADTLLDCSLTGCYEITDAGIRALCARCSRITVLHVSDTRRLTDQAVRYISELLPNLVELHLAMNEKMTASALRHLRAGCTQLRLLDVWRSGQISTAAVLTLKQRGVKVIR